MIEFFHKYFRIKRCAFFPLWLCCNDIFFQTKCVHELEAWCLKSATKTTCRQKRQVNCSLSRSPTIFKISNTSPHPSIFLWIFHPQKTPPQKNNTAPGLGNPEISKIEGADPFGVEVDGVWCFEKVGVSFFLGGGEKSQTECSKCMGGGWFKIFVMFTPNIWGR